MQTRKLGTTDIELPVITLGTMNWGQQCDEAEAHAQLDYAVEERGVTSIDTAEIYPIPPTAEKQGLTETYIGNWLKKRGKRDDLIIASKVAPAAFIRTRDVGDKARLDRKSIREAVEGSLQRLQTDYLDVYYLHFPERKTFAFGARGVQSLPEDDATSFEETYEAMAELVKEGKIRHIAVSNENPWGLSEYLRIAREKQLPKPVAIQNQYSLTNRTYELGLSEMTMHENIGLMAYSVLGMGVLTGKYMNGARPEGARFSLNPRSSERYNAEAAQPAIKKYVELANKHGLDPATLAIAFAKHQAFVASVIIGATSLEQLKVCIDAGEVTLSDEVLEGIAKIHAQYPDVTC